MAQILDMRTRAAPFELTTRMRYALQRAATRTWPIEGVIGHLPEHGGAASWHRMMRELVEHGFFEALPAKYFRITDKGREAAK